MASDDQTPTAAPVRECPGPNGQGCDCDAKGTDPLCPWWPLHDDDVLPPAAAKSHYPAREQTLKLLNDLCEDSLEVPLSHVDALERDGVLHEYGISSKFKWLRDLIEANINA